MDHLLKTATKNAEETIMQNVNYRTSSISPTRKTSRKGILKNVNNNNNRRSIATSNASDLSDTNNTSRSLSPNSKAEYHKRTGLHMKWDEMNIIATYHPSDKDYGFMKVDEPKTPYNKDFEGFEDEACKAIDASKLESELNLNKQKLPKYMQEQMNLSSNNAEPEDDDGGNRNPEFEAHRKEHYNEFKMAQLLRSRMKDEDDEKEDDVATNILNL